MAENQCGAEVTPDELRAIRDAATPGPWSWNEARPSRSGASASTSRTPAAPLIPARWRLGTREWLQVGPDRPTPTRTIADLDRGREADAALIALAPDLASLLADAIEALEAMTELAAVAHNGDPWYAEHEGLDANAIFQERQDFLAHFQALGDKS